MPSTMSPIVSRKTGRPSSEADPQPPRHVDELGVRGLDVTVRGSSAMPQIGQAPARRGRSQGASGRCIRRGWGLLDRSGSSAMPHFGQAPGDPAGPPDPSGRVLVPGAAAGGAPSVAARNASGFALNARGRTCRRSSSECRDSRSCRRRFPDRRSCRRPDRSALPAAALRRGRDRRGRPAACVGLDRVSGRFSSSSCSSWISCAGDLREVVENRAIGPAVAVAVLHEVLERALHGLQLGDLASRDRRTCAWATRRTSPLARRRFCHSPADARHP